MLLTGAALVVLSAALPAPIAAPIAKMDEIAADAQAPWFFLWVQQLLKWGDPFLMGIVLPALVLTAIAVIPYTLPSPSPGELGRWFPHSNRIAQYAVIAIVLAWLLLTIIGSRPSVY